MDLFSNQIFLFQSPPKLIQAIRFLHFQLSIPLACATIKPMSWSVLGHTWAADMLQQQIARGMLRHAYLFSGPEGVGRRTLALRFAQAINCPQSAQPGQPCGVCRTCRQIEAMQHADLMVVQSESEGEALKVNQVRDLQRNLALAPYESAYRVALLLRMEEATAGAQNALLKTLEEPNPRVVLLLTADEPENLLPTVASRCELLRLRPMPLEELAGALISLNGLDAERAHLIAHIAAGRPGYAMRLIADESLLAARDAWLSDLFSLLGAKQRERLAYSQKLAKGRERADARADLRDGLAHWLSLWRDVLLTASQSNAPLTNLDCQKQIEELAGMVGQRTSAQAVMRLEHACARLANANLQLMLDNLLLEWPRL